MSTFNFLFDGETWHQSSEPNSKVTIECVTAPWIVDGNAIASGYSDEFTTDQNDTLTVNNLLLGQTYKLTHKGKTNSYHFYFSSSASGTFYASQLIVPPATGSSITYNALSASYAATASVALNGGSGGTNLVTGSTYPITSSAAVSSSNALTLVAVNPLIQSGDAKTITFNLGSSSLASAYQVSALGTGNAAQQSFDVYTQTIGTGSQTIQIRGTPSGQVEIFATASGIGQFRTGDMGIGNMQPGHRLVFYNNAAPQWGIDDNGDFSPQFPGNTIGLDVPVTTLYALNVSASAVTASQFKGTASVAIFAPSYLPLAGGTLTGLLKISDGDTGIKIGPASSTDTMELFYDSSDFWRMRPDSWASAGGGMLWEHGNTGGFVFANAENSVNIQLQGSATNNLLISTTTFQIQNTGGGSFDNGAITTDGSGNITANSFNGALHGNADTATSATTATSASYALTSSFATTAKSSSFGTELPQIQSGITTGIQGTSVNISFSKAFPNTLYAVNFIGSGSMPLTGSRIGGPLTTTGFTASFGAFTGSIHWHAIGLV